jgi:hypothetical protein
MPHDHDDDDDDNPKPRTEQFTRNRRLVGDWIERLEKRAPAPKPKHTQSIEGPNTKTHILQFTVNAPLGGDWTTCQRCASASKMLSPILLGAHAN